MRKSRFGRLFQELFISIGLSIAMFLAIFILGEQAIYAFNETSYGTHGRLSIPSLNIDVAVYNSHGNDSQAIVDEIDSAAFINWKNQNAIVDHRSQSFYYLPDAIPGLTKACIITPMYTDYYVCTYVGNGKITYGADHLCSITDEWGDAVNLANSGGICMYTCQGEMDGDEVPVCITYWKLANPTPLHFIERILLA